jgi:hypothetical protein
MGRGVMTCEIKMSSSERRPSCLAALALGTVTWCARTSAMFNVQCDEEDRFGASSERRRRE